MHQKKEVRVFKTNLLCEECGGIMLPMGGCLCSSPPQYPHACQDCGSQINVRGETYPKITYEEVSQEDLAWEFVSHLGDVLNRNEGNINGLIRRIADR